MKIVSASFMAILVLSMTSSSALLTNPQEPVNEAFAQTGSSINDLGNYVIFGFEEVEIKKDVIITNGNVGVNDEDSEVKLDKGTVFNDPNSGLVGDSVKIEKDAIVQNVFYNELENKGEILGIQNTPLSLPVIDNFPNIPVSPPGTTSIGVDKDETLTLSAGQYDTIFVDEGATLIFEGGSFSAASIEAKKEANILFDDSSEVVIQNELKLDKETTLEPSQTSTISASDIVIFVVNGDVSIDKDSVIDANIFASNGEIKIDKGAQATGAFVANKVKIDKDSTLTLDSSLQIFALIDELEDLIAEIDSLVDQVEQNLIAEGTPSPETLALLTVIEDKTLQISVIVDELENLGVIVTPIVVEGSIFPALLVAPLGFEPRELNLPNGVCGAIMWLSLLEFAAGEVPLDGLQLVTLLVSSAVFCADVNDFSPLTDLNLFLESKLFMLAIAVGALDLFATGVDLVASGLNQIDLREFWLQTAIDFDSVPAFNTDATGIVQAYRPVLAGTVDGSVFGDSNQNMIFDSGEFGLSGWTVEASFSKLDLTEITFDDISQGVPTAGKYNFDDLPTGIYTVREILMPGFTQTSPVGDIYTINVLADSDFTELDFGNHDITAELTVIKNVINDDGGTLNPSDFMIHVTGNNPSPADFTGSGGSAGILFQDDYSTNSGWTQVGTLVTVDDPNFPDITKFNGVPDASDRRVHKSIGTTLSDAEWILESEFLVNAHSGNPSHVVFAVTSGSNDPITANQDLIGISYNSISFDPLGFEIVSKDGNGAFQDHGTKITFGIGEQVYLRLARTSATTVTLEVFSDAARTQHITGSPVMVTDIPATITGLNTLQHANGSTGGFGRNLTAEIDNTVISGIVSIGTLVEISPGAYSVTEDAVAGYTGSFSADCTGSILTGESKTCIITNDDDASGGGTTVDLTGLRAYYQFDETSGNLINLAGAVGSTDSFGSVVDGIVDSGVVQGVPGIIDEAYEWDGTTSNRKVSLGSSTSIWNFMHNTNAEFTVNFWVERDQIGQFHDIFIDKNNSGSNRGINVEISNDTPRVTIRNGAGGPSSAVIDFAGTQTVPANEFVMVTVRYDQSLSADNAIITVNGDIANQDLGTKTSAVPSNANSNFPMTLGTNTQNQAGRTLDGSLDEFAIWSRVLTDQEVIALYNNGDALDLGNIGTTTETIIPTDSTYNNSGSASTSAMTHNDDGFLLVESATNFNGHDTRKIWLKFDLPVTTVTSATLSLFAVSGETLPTSTDVYFHNDNNWSEDTLTFNNEPAHFAGLTSGPHATNTVSAVNQYYDFDVTNLINTAGSTTVTMVFSNTLIEANNAIAFTDETTSTPPLLVIEYE